MLGCAHRCSSSMAEALALRLPSEAQPTVPSVFFLASLSPSIPTPTIPCTVPRTCLLIAET